MAGKREKPEVTPLQNHRGCSKSFDDGQAPPAKMVVAQQTAEQPSGLNTRFRKVSGQVCQVRWQQHYAQS